MVQKSRHPTVLPGEKGKKKARARFFFPLEPFVTQHLGGMEGSLPELKASCRSFDSTYHVTDPMYVPTVDKKKP